MKKLSFVICFIILSCNSSDKLEEGRWTGTLSPMNHPEMENSVAYDVSYNDSELAINLIGPNENSVPVKNPRLMSDTLYFSFNEPEENVSLNCALGKSGHGFSGRCTDPDGKWARSTMNPPR